MGRRTITRGRGERPAPVLPPSVKEVVNLPRLHTLIKNMCRRRTAEFIMNKEPDGDYWLTERHLLVSLKESYMDELHTLTQGTQKYLCAKPEDHETLVVRGGAIIKDAKEDINSLLDEGDVPDMRELYPTPYLVIKEPESNLYYLPNPHLAIGFSWEPLDQYMTVQLNDLVFIQYDLVACIAENYQDFTYMANPTSIAERESAVGALEIPNAVYVYGNDGRKLVGAVAPMVLRESALELYQGFNALLRSRV